MHVRAVFSCFIVMVGAGCSSLNEANNIANELTVNFSKAVEEKNSEMFKSLFLNENVSWLAVISAHDLHKVYKNDQNQKKSNGGGF